MQKFKIRIAGTLSATIIIIIGILITLNFHSFQTESVSLNKALLQEKNSAVKAVLSEKFLGYQQMFSSMRLTQDDIGTDKLSDKAVVQLKSLYKAQQSISDGVYIFLSNGDIYDAVGAKQDFNVKTLNRSYYNAIFAENHSFFVSPPFNSAVTGKEVLGMAYRLNNDIAVLSVVYLEAVLEDLSERTDMFMYTSDGTILIAPYPQLVKKNIFAERPLYRQFNKNMKVMSYSANVDGQDIPFTAFWGTLDATGWGFVTYVKDSTIGAGAHDQLISSLIIGAISLVISIAIILTTVNKLVLKPVGGAPDEIALMMEKIASGDLTQNLVNTGKETGIYLSLVNLNRQLSELIHSSHTSSDKVLASSMELNRMMTSTHDNAQDELAQVEQITTAINELSSTSQEVSDKATQAETEASNALDNAEKGKQTIEHSQSLTNSISASVTDTASLVRELQEFAQEIGSVTEVINGISEQTNLLALNAAIEAARAGEHGRGFAVVADEVRNLASKTQSSTVSIQQVIEKLQSQAEKASDNIVENVGLIEQSVKLADEVKSSFVEITTSISSISEINTLVATASTQQYSVTEEISKNASITFDLVNRNVSSVNQSLSASAELSDQADSQKKELSYFRV